MNMPKIFSTAIVIAVNSIYANGAVRTASSDPLLAKAEVVIKLAQSLASGVDECFNPAHADANNHTKQNFLALAASVQAMRADISNRHGPSLAADSSLLQASLNSFADAAPFPASLTCATERECLELGFAGNSKYVRCLPVNGNVHANAQYLAFEKLLDQALPELVTSLQSH
jgi:hypothetical protein